MIMWFGIFILCISLLLMIGVLFIVFPKLRALDLREVKEEQHRQKKEELIFKKISRTSKGKVFIFVIIFRFISEIVSKFGRRWVQKIYKIEQSYQKKKQILTEGMRTFSNDTLEKMLVEAKAFSDDGEFILAEKKFIEIISHNAKFVRAYEGLGRLYFSEKMYEQAKETLLFALKLSPNDASVSVSLAQVEEALGDMKKALDYMKKAVAKRSKNPKYLDYFIEYAILCKSTEDAKNGLKMLKEVNPENQKIQDFEEEIREIEDKSGV